MVLKQKFSGVFFKGKKLFTKNLVPSQKVYGEKLLKEKGTEFRFWDPMRSKLAAAIHKGLNELPVKKGSRVLYLGIAEGTTASHLSDIVEEKGLIFGVDVSARAMQKLLILCEKRENILPLLADANKPEKYEKELSEISFDVLYQDISQKNQAEIFLKNSRFLKKNGYGLLVLKGKSISQKEKPSQIFKKEISKLKKQFKVLQVIDLNPFDKSHAMVYCKKT
jgi:fibrillarin-like pre-rRNA processing protein